MQAPTEESFGFAERFLSPPFHVNLIYGLRFFQAG